MQRDAVDGVGVHRAGDRENDRIMIIVRGLKLVSRKSMNQRFRTKKKSPNKIIIHND